MTALEMRQRMPRAIDTAEIIDIHQTLDGLDTTELVEPRAHADAGVVDERIDSPVLVDCTGNQSAALVFYGHIGGHAYRLSSASNAFRDDRFEQEWLARGEYETSTVRAKLVRHL